MNNINECRCITVHNLRQHHGVVCTTCNPNRIEKLVVPGTVTGYRVWKFDHQHGFRNTTGRKRGWSEFISISSQRVLCETNHKIYNDTL